MVCGTSFGRGSPLQRQPPFARGALPPFEPNRRLRWVLRGIASIVGSDADDAGGPPDAPPCGCVRPGSRADAALARALYDNGGFVGYAVNQIALYSAPVVPQAASLDDGWNKAAETWFGDWAKRADFMGRPEMDPWAFQTQVCQALDFDGDPGVAIAADAGFPQVQIVDGWRIGSGFTGCDSDVVDGVKLDARGRVMGTPSKREESRLSSRHRR